MIWRDISITGTRSRPPGGRPGQALDAGGHAHAFGRDADADDGFSGCARATTITPRAIRPSGLACVISRGSGCIRSTGRKNSTARASAWSSSARRHGRHLDPVLGGRRGARDNAAAFAHVFRGGFSHPSAGDPAARTGRAPRLGARDHAARLRRQGGRRSSHVLRTSRGNARVDRRAGARAPARGLRRGEAFQPELSPMAATHRAGSRRRPVRRHPLRQGVSGHRRHRALRRHGRPVGQRRAS